MSFKFIPMLFSTEIVRFLLDNRKTETRRLKGLENIDLKATEIVKSPYFQGKGCWVAQFQDPENENQFIVTDLIKCPFGDVGDVIWVRETFQEIEFVKSGSSEFLYKADCDLFNPDIVSWSPSIHMPKKAARLFCKITNIHVERLQSISEKGAIAEGVSSSLKPSDMELMRGLKNWTIPSPFLEHQFGFLALWCRLYGCDSWLKNPWVWVIKFEQIEKPENFIS